MIFWEAVRDAVREGWEFLGNFFAANFPILLVIVALYLIFVVDWAFILQRDENEEEDE